VHGETNGELGHAGRDRLWRRVVLAVVVAVLATLAASSAASADAGTVTLPASGAAAAAVTPSASLPSLIGRWIFNAQYNVTATTIAEDFSLEPGGKIDGYLEPTPSAAQCLQESGGPNNQNILYGDGPIYTGVGVWSSGCSPIGYGPLVIDVDTSVTPNTWSSCSNQPGGPAPVFGSCQASVTAVKDSVQPFPGSTGVVFPTRILASTSTGESSGSSGSLDVPVQCGSSYYQGTTPCDATYYVWHCGSSYSTAFMPCPPNTPGALPPVKSSVLTRGTGAVSARSSSGRAVAVAGGTVTIGPKKKMTLKFGLTSQAKSGFAALRRKLAALATQADRASARGHTSAARRLRSELARLSKVTLMARVTNNTNGVSKTSRLTVTFRS
jgi:hypothetical protein